MQNENILDHEEPILPDVYGNKSLRYLLLSIGFLGLTFAIVFLEDWMNLDDDITLLGVALPLLAMLMTALLSCFNGLQSIRYREASAFKKYIGLIGSIILLLVLGGVVFASLVRTSAAVTVAQPAPPQILEEPMPNAPDASSDSL